MGKWNVAATDLVPGLCDGMRFEKANIFYFTGLCHFDASVDVTDAG
jgi:hypothetical protein